MFYVMIADFGDFFFQLFITFAQLVFFFKFFFSFW